jgi:hypothetical protein
MSCGDVNQKKNRWKETQQFQTADVITTQFKSIDNVAKIKREELRM